MPLSSISLEYKPLRIGFLVRDNSIEDLVTAAGINTLLWGGIFNPVIPISVENNDLAHQLVKLFSVDILYAVSNTQEILDFKKNYPFLKDSFTDDIFYESLRSNGRFFRFLDSKNAIDYLWEKEIRHWDKERKSAFSLIEWEDNDSLASVLSLGFGYFPKFPDKELENNYRQLFLDGLQAENQKIPLDAPVKFDIQENYSPIYFTKLELSYSERARIFHRGIYIGLKDSFYDLLSFWNLRAAGDDIVFLAKDAWERTFQYAKSHVDFIDSIPVQLLSISNRTFVYYSQIEDQEFQDINAKISSKKGLIWSFVSEDLWNGLNIKPHEPFFKQRQVVSSFIEQSGSGFIVSVELPKKKFLVNEDDAVFNSQRLGVTIDASGEHYYPDSTLDLPYIPELNEFYSRSIRFDPYELRRGKNGLTISIDTTDSSIKLLPISKIILIKKFFELAGIEACISQPGLIANKIIEKIGGIENVRVLKMKGIRMLLEKGSPFKSVTRSEATKTIFDHGFEQHKRLFIDGRLVKDLGTDHVFNFLLKKDFFRAGLELKCSQCNLPNWLPLKKIDDKWECEYCGANDIISVYLKNGSDWKFRKSGLFAKDNHQEGAIPVLLTLLALKRVLDRANFCYSTALKLDGGNIKCETDFCVYEESYIDGLNIAIGECKSDGGTITKQDCDNLKFVASELSKIGDRTNVYITFSKTADIFQPEEIDLFRDLVNDFGLILFTSVELEPYHPYTSEMKEGKPYHTHAMSMKDLAQNSAVTYLQV
ncbi:MAG: hypothetical protein ACHQD8_02915 [Chitinophagales bacterium]